MGVVFLCEYDRILLRAGDKASVLWISALPHQIAGGLMLI